MHRVSSHAALRSVCALSLALCLVHPLRALEAPHLSIGLAGEGLRQGVLLSWSAVPGTDEYRVYRKFSPQGASELLATLPDTSLVLTPGSQSMTFYWVLASGATSWPDTPAPVPVHDPQRVISLFSESYFPWVVDTWSAPWDQAELTLLDLEGNATLLYTQLNYAGIEFISAPLDARLLTHLHLDVWTPGPTAAPAEFRIKLVDFGANGVWNGGGDDVEDELAFNELSSPALGSHGWYGLDIPLQDFSGLVTREHLAQLLFSGDPDSVFVDNLYFWSENDLQPSDQPPPAPIPQVAVQNVLSLFSDSYPAWPVDTWSAGWDQADLETVVLQGNPALHYTNLSWAGIEFIGHPIDAWGLSHLHLDLWTSQGVQPDTEFVVRLVDFGGNGVYGGGDDSEHDVAWNSSSQPPLQAFSWVGIDIPLAQFSGLAATEHLAQLLLLGDLSDCWVDNLYLYDDGSFQPPASPLAPAPVPGLPAMHVISLFSDSYPDVPVDAWSSDLWPDMADVSEVVLQGNAMKLYTNLEFAVIDFASQPISASGMTHIHLDLWIPDALDSQSVVSLTLIDFGANGVWDGGGDDVEGQLSLTPQSVPPLRRGRWLSLELPLADFEGLQTTDHLARIVITSGPDSLYLDNLYFYDGCAARSATPLVYFR